MARVLVNFSLACSASFLSTAKLAPSSIAKVAICCRIRKEGGGAPEWMASLHEGNPYHEMSSSSQESVELKRRATVVNMDSGLASTLMKHFFSCQLG